MAGPTVSSQVLHSLRPTAARPGHCPGQRAGLSAAGLFVQPAAGTPACCLLPRSGRAWRQGAPCSTPGAPNQCPLSPVPATAAGASCSGQRQAAAQLNCGMQRCAAAACLLLLLALRCTVVAAQRAAQLAAEGTPHLMCPSWHECPLALFPYRQSRSLARQRDSETWNGAAAGPRSGWGAEQGAPAEHPAAPPAVDTWG